MRIETRTTYNVQIYGLIDPRDQKLRYIGFTSKSLEERLLIHLKNTSNKSYKNSWIKSLSKENLKPEIFKIQDTDICSWESDEKWNIAYFKSIGCELTNMTIGGEGVVGRKVTDECKKRMSLAKLGIKRSDIVKKKISDSLIGNKRTLGRVRPPEERQRISEKLKGRKSHPPSEETKLKMRMSRLKHLEYLKIKDNLKLQH